MESILLSNSAIASILLLGPGAGSLLALTLANLIANHGLGRVPPRLAYTIVVVFLVGTLLPAFALREFLRAGVVEGRLFGFSAAAIAAAMVLGGGFLFLSIREEPAEQRRRVPTLLVALFAPSLAEVLVFAGIVFAMVEHLMCGAGPVIAGSAAVAATSLSFALYHLTHAAPWNNWRVLKILLVVWIVIAGFAAVTRNLWATALLNTLLATIGFVKNRVTRPEQQPLAVSFLLDVLAVVSVAWLCRTPV